MERPVNSSVVLAIASLASLALLACMGCKTTSRNDMITPEDRASAAVSSADPPLGGGPLSAAGALNMLADARCDREAKCGMLGDKRLDREGCERDALKLHAHDVELLGCNGSIDNERVASCAEKLRSFTCDRDATSASAVCGAGRLCTKD